MPETIESKLNLPLMGAFNLQEIHNLSGRAHTENNLQNMQNYKNSLLK